MWPLVWILLKAFFFVLSPWPNFLNTLSACTYNKNSLNLGLLDEGPLAYSSIHQTLTCSGFTASSSDRVPAQVLRTGKHSHKSIVLNLCWSHSFFPHLFFNCQRDLQIARREVIPHPSDLLDACFVNSVGARWCIFYAIFLKAYRKASTTSDHFEITKPNHYNKSMSSQKEIILSCSLRIATQKFKSHHW